MYDNLRAFKSAPVPFWHKVALGLAYGGVAAFCALALLYWLSVPAYAAQPVQGAQFKADALDFILGDRPTEHPGQPRPPRKVYATPEVNAAYDAYPRAAVVEIEIIVRPAVVTKENRPEGRTYRQYQRDQRHR